jgi:hypothetical protein
MISFIIYFHSSRIKHLQQTIRFLEKREPTQEFELILVCQDSISPFLTNFKSTKLFNLDVKDYCKPKMCNFGVNQAENDKIVILDSDRILPSYYFTHNANKLNNKEVITTHKLYSLVKEYNDDEIENNHIELISDFRSKDNIFFQKNAFSGNTMMYRKDYIPMDEQFVGYGFADNDATKTALLNGLKITYTDDVELHLFHPREIYLNDKKLDYYKTMDVCRNNGVRYANKWGLKPPVYPRKII